MAVGSILYAVRCTRPDVAFTQNITSCFQQNPGEPHWTTMKTFLSWKSPKQSTTAMSATEAGYIAASEAAMEVVYIRKFISGLDPFMKALPEGKLTQHARSMGHRLASSFIDATSSSRQHVDNVEQNDASDSDLDDDDYNIYEYDSESEESDTASVDHLSDGEEEIYDTRTRQPDPKPKKMFDVTSDDNIGDKFPIHDPTVKWKLMRPVLGEKYESPDQLKRALAFYALANGYKLYYEVNNPRRLLAKFVRGCQKIGNVHSGLMSMDSMGIPRPAWPEGITPQDCIIEAATQSEIAISQSPPVESQEQEAPMQEQPVQEQPLQEQPVQRRPVQQPVQRKSERIAQILFNKPPTPGPGLDPDDAISIE
ncbi:hypothetical protein Tco_0693001 [Tanacetum coccineum]